MGNAAAKEGSDDIVPACLQPFSGGCDVINGDGSSDVIYVDKKLNIFIAQIECISKASDWSHEETAVHAIKALTGKAKTWADNLIIETPEDAKSWKDLKPRLISRFANTLRGTYKQY